MWCLDEREREREREREIQDRGGDQEMRVRIVGHDGSLVDPEVNMDEIQDVTCPAPTDGQMLVFDSATGKWAASDSISGSARCSAYRDTSAQTIADNTEVKVQLNAKEWDVDDEFDNATNFRFVAGATGYYIVSACVRMSCASAGAGERGQAILKVNGTAKARGIDVNDITAERSFPVNKTLYVGAGQYIELFIWQNSGGNGSVVTGLENTYMTVDRIN